MKITIPAEHLDKLGDNVVVMRGPGRCLCIFTKKEWGIIVGRLSDLADSSVNYKSFVRLFISGAIEMNLDKTGVIIIPKHLKDYAELGRARDIKFVDQTTYPQVGLEIWNKTQFFKKSITEEVKKQFRLDLNSIHGITHWQRVREIGLYLATGTSVDLMVVGLFSVLHDSQRKDEYQDPEHGPRAAKYIVALHRRGRLVIGTKQLEQLIYACRYHSNREAQSDDITIQTCWDADRLDLYRLSEIPDEKYLYTEAAKKKEARDFALKLLSK